jgi:hypothetical protein
VQYSLLERAMPSPETLATLTARLARWSARPLRLGRDLDTWRPDRFEMRRFRDRTRDPRDRPAQSPARTSISAASVRLSPSA